MSDRDPGKKISAAAIQALKEALTNAYWYKSDLRSFLNHTISNPAILSRVSWDQVKRNIVSSVVDFLARNERVYQRQLVRLMTETANISDLSHLARLKDGKTKSQKAKAALDALRNQIQGHLDLVEEEKAIEKRRADSHERQLQATAVKEQLEQLKTEYFTLLSSDNPQQRGFKLEKLLQALFNLFDLDPRASFRIKGEQIDGAFTFDATDYLLEAKWQKEPVSANDLDVFAGKLLRKLENTLGLFLSINGFSLDGVAAHSSGQLVLFLMDGSDLMAVLEGRIDLIQLLLRKRREASQKGNIYLKIHEILTSTGK